MKFSIATPTFNSRKYIEETILSIITQKGKFSIEYIIFDNYSEDGTEDVVKNYQALLEKRLFPIQCEDVKIIYLREKDRGMYDAINKSFSRATGEIYAWINADDIYLPGAFELIQKTLTTFPDIKWVKGITSYINEQGVMWKTGKCWLYKRLWISAGHYGRDLHFIQQDSVFWRSELWSLVGEIDSSYKMAGDYDLWLKFAKHAELVSVCAPVSCFRTVQGQLSQNSSLYNSEVLKISNVSRKGFTFIARIKHYLADPLMRIIYLLLLPRYTCDWVKVDRSGNISLMPHRSSNFEEYIEL